MTKTLRLRLSGRVQNVGYRAFAVRLAVDLGLSGWVRNRTNGQVEILVAGDEAALELVIARCRQGPRLARVDDVAVSDTTEAAPSGFEERPTR